MQVIISIYNMATKGISDFSGFNILVQDTLPVDDTLVPQGVTEVLPTEVKGGELRIPSKKEEIQSTEFNTSELEIDGDSGETSNGEETVSTTTIPKKKEEKTKDKEEDNNPFQAFAEELAKKGILEIGEKKIESEDDLANAVATEIEGGIESYKQSLGGEAQKFIEYLERGGDPANYIQKKATFNYLKTTDEQIKADVNLQKNVIKDLLTRQGYDFEEIKDKLNDYEESGILEKESLRALKQVKNQDLAADTGLIEAQKQEQARRQEAYQGYLKNISDMIDKKTEIAGFQIIDKQKKPFYDYITKANSEVNGQPATQMQADMATDPDGQLKMAWFYFNKFDMTKFKKQADSKAASRLRETLGRYSDSREKVSGRSGSSEEKPDINIFKKNLNI